MLHTVFFYEKRFRNAFGVRERIIVFLLNIYVKSLIAYTNKQSVGRISVERRSHVLPLKKQC